MAPPPSAAAAKVNAMCSKLDAMENWSSRRAAAVEDQPQAKSRSSSRGAGPHALDGSKMSCEGGVGAGPSDQGVVTLCAGMRYLPEGATRKELSASPAFRSQVQPMALEQLHRAMHAMENEARAPRKKMPPMPGRPAATEPTHRDRTGSTEVDEDAGLPAKQFEFSATGEGGPMTFAQALHSQDIGGRDFALDGGLSTEARLNRKRQKEEARAARQQSRAQRQLAADMARVDFGLTTKEKKARKNRELKLEQQAFEASQATAAMDFRSRGAKIFFANLVSLLSQLLLIFDGYQAKYVSEELPAGLTPAPVFVFVYTLCGIVGSTIALISVTILYAVLYAQGLKAKSLQMLCPIAVHAQYLSSFLQLLSMFNHLGYLSTLFGRISDAYPGPQGEIYWLAIIVTQMAIGPTLPFVLVFTIYQAKQMCYSNLKKLIAAEVIQKHIFYAIGFCQVASSIMVIGFCSLNFTSIYMELLPTHVFNDDGSLRQLGPFIVNYTYALFPIVGVICFFLGLFYLLTTRSMNAYELETLALEDNQETTLLSGQRVPLQKGSHCMLRHIVDKPSMNGQTGTLVHNGTDESGRVTVNVEGKELKLEEFQIGVVTDEHELAVIKERAELRTAELLYLYQSAGQKLKRKQIIYVTTGQVMTGLLVTFIIIVVTQSRFFALSVYQPVRTTIPMDYAYANSTNLEIIRSTDRVLRIQASLCDYWAKCFDLAPKSSVCGSCSIPTPSYLTSAALVRTTFTNHNIFQGDSLVAIIVYSSIGGAAGLLIGLTCLPTVARMRCFSTIVVTVTLVIYCACIGLAVAPLPSVLRSSNPLTEDQCKSGDIDPGTPGIQRVSTECLKITAAYQAYDSFEQDGRLSVTGCLVNMLFFIFESLFNLARSIRAHGPTLWAKLEVNVFLYYFVVVAVFLLAANILESALGQMFEYLINIYRDVTLFSSAMTFLYGEAFPLYYDYDWQFARQMVVGGYFWYNMHLTGPTLAVVLTIQIIGIVASCRSEDVWVPVLRVVLIIDLVVCVGLYSAMAYLSMTAVNLVANVIAIATIPLSVQLLFALFYAVQSDILPIFESLPSNTILKCAFVSTYNVPVVALLLLVLGVSYHIFYVGAGPVAAGETNLAVGLSLMTSGAVGALVIFALVACVFARRFWTYYDDWTQMAADTLARKYPSMFGNRAEPEDDMDDEEPDEENAVSADVADALYEREVEEDEREDEEREEERERDASAKAE